MWMYIMGALLGGKTGQASTTKPQSFGPSTGQFGSMVGGQLVLGSTPTYAAASSLKQYAGAGKRYAQTGHISTGPTYGIAARQARTGSVASFGAINRTIASFKVTPVVSPPTNSTVTYGSSSGGTGSQYKGASAYNQI